MNDNANALASGLYLVATPIGSARDITLRALDVLRDADVIAAEDTRNIKKLMAIHGIATAGRQFLSYHDHNGAKVRPKILKLLEEGRSVAYASDAGTPLIADPGFDLAREVRASGFDVVAVPGASAVVTALMVGGLPTDRFLFAGFPPTAKGKRSSFLAELADVRATLAFYESGQRVAATLADISKILGADRQVSICRELTKKFEEVIRGTAGELVAELAAKPLKGEVVLLVDRGEKVADAGDLDGALKEALKTMRTKEAAEAVSLQLGLPRRMVYQRALQMGDIS